VSLEQIQKQSGTYNGVASNWNYTCNDFAILMPDSVYSISVSTGNNEYAKVYIDYNNDGDFTDAGEEVVNFSQGSGGRSLSFTAPSNPVVNRVLRMRVISDVAAISGPCDTLTSGESEDYGVRFDSPQAEIYSSSASACPNYPTQFWATTQGKVDSLFWDFGIFASPRYATGVGPHTTQYSGSGSWKVKVRVNADRWFEDSVQIIASPTADISLDSANSSLCEGGYAKLLVINNSGVAGSFSWFWNGNPISGKTDSVLNVSKLNTFVNYDYQVVTGNGTCFDTSDVFTLQPHDRPTSWIGIIKTTQCLEGNEFVFNDNSLFQGGSLIRKWEFGDGTTDTVKNARHSYLQVGSYVAKLIVTSDKNCSDTSSKTVDVLANPDSTFSINPVSGMTYEFVPNDTNQSAYVWDFGDSNTSNLKLPQHTYQNSGVYLVSLHVTGTNSCEGSSVNTQQVEDINISLSQFSEWFGIRVYPNPGSGVFYLETEGERLVEYSLFDAAGRLLEQGKSNGEMLLQEFEVEQSGLYLLKVKIDGIEATYKLTVN
jgi:PKD repeat protein